MSQRPPNFVFIITDQHRADWLGCAGHPLVKTPNIDALAATGTRFTDFHVASPICMPNRASLMTGRMPSAHGLRYNGCALPRSARTFVDVLRAAGYDTGLMGKSHLQPFTTDAAKHLPDPEGQPPRLIEEAWDKPPEPSDEAPSNYDSPTPYDVAKPYYGFDHAEIATHHGDRCGGHYKQWLQRTYPDDWQAWWDPANELPHDYTCPQARRTPVPEEAYPTAWVGDRATRYLQDPARQANPFFAFVSFPDPHHPFNPPGRYWDMYDPADFDLPLPAGSHQNPPPALKWLEDNFAKGGGQFTPQTATRVSERGLQEAMALTAGMITMIDDQVGRVVQALKDADLYDNTVIIFTSDHGDYMGDFGLLLKGAMPTKAITQVPMIWSDPMHRQAQETDALAATLDIGPTILDRVGLTPYRGIQGTSFLRSVQHGTPHRDDVLIEYNDGAAKFGFDHAARVRTLRSKDWRLSLYVDEDWGELYDLQSDPDETHNLWDDPDHASIKGTLALRLAHRLTRQMDESPRSTLIA